MTVQSASLTLPVASPQRQSSPTTKAVLDEKLYQVTCRTLDEAYYLLAIVNSNALAQAAKPFCGTNWAREIRDLHKHLWKLPIPAYDPNNTDHLNLSRLARRATVEAQTIITNLGNPPPTVTKARSILRHQWQPNSATAQGIEAGVRGLLG